MKSVLTIILVAVVCGCSGKKIDPNAETTPLFSQKAFDAYGISNDRIQLGIQLKQSEKGEKTYHLTARTLIPNEKITPVAICTFESQELALADEVVRQSAVGVSIVKRASQKLDEATKEPLTDIFITSLDTAELKNKKTEILLEDSRTLVLARNMEIHNRAKAKNTQCEFNYYDYSERISNKPLQSAKAQR